MRGIPIRFLSAGRQVVRYKGDGQFQLYNFVVVIIRTMSAVGMWRGDLEG